MSTVSRVLVKMLCCCVLVLLHIPSMVCAQNAAGVSALRIGGAKPLSAEIVPNSPHTQGISSAAFSGNGQLLLSGGGNNFGGDYKLRLWNVATGALIRIFLGHTWKVTSVAISADGLKALSGSRDGKAILWDTATGQSLRVFKGANGSEITSVALSADGQRVLVGFDDEKAAKLFDASTGALLKTFRGHTAGVASVAFSADGRRIVTGGRDFKAILWDVASGKALHVLKGHTSQVTAVAFSPNGRVVVSGEILPNPTVKFWDAMDGSVLATLRGHTSNINSFAFSPDGTEIFSAAADGFVKQWNVAGRLLERTFKLAGGEINAIAVSPDGKSLAVAGDDLELRSTVDGKRIRKFGADAYAASSVAFSPDGTQFVAGGSDAAIALYDGQTGNLVRRFLGHSGSVNAVVFSPDGSRIASGGTDETAKIWDASSGALLLTLSHAPNSTAGGLVGVTSVAFLPDGARIVTGNGDDTVRIWNARSGALLRTVAGHYYSVSSVAFSPDGSRIVSAGGTDETVRVWNAETGASLRKFGKPNPDLDGGPVGGATAALFLPDGLRVLSVTPDPSTIQLWNMNTGRVLRTFAGHSSIVSSLAISKDGTLALSGSYDRSIKLWNLSTGALVRTFVDTSEVDAVAFSPDGRRALSSSHDGSLKVWNTQNGELLVTILGGNGWLSITPAGFFSGSEEKAMAVNAIRGFQVFSIDQLYQALYRPDLVRRKISADFDEGLIAGLAEQRLNIDKVIDSGAAPRVSIISPKAGAVLGDTEVAVDVTISNQGGGIGRIEWRINGITLGVQDVGDEATKNQVSIKRTLSLGNGTYSIDVVAYNSQNLVASLPASLSVSIDSAAPQRRPNLYVLAIGVDKYRDGSIPSLAFAAADARSVASAFGLPAVSNGIYDRVIVLPPLLDNDASMQQIQGAFEKLQGLVLPQDVFVLYLSGHGFNYDGQYYFMPYGADSADDNVLKSSSIGERKLQEWLSTIKALRSVIVSDTCESGSIAEASNSFRGGQTVASEKLSRSMGRSVFSATTDIGVAKEGYKGHGVFTYVLLDALALGDENSDGKLQASELGRYLATNVPRLSEKLRTVRQQPQVRIIGAEFEISNRIDILIVDQVRATQ